MKFNLYIYFLIINHFYSKCKNYGQKCPETSPCCKEGWCSNDPSFCSIGCQPEGSYLSEVCVPRFYCKDLNFNFKNDNVKIINENDYSGNPDDADLVSKFKPDYYELKDGNLILSLKYDGKLNEAGKTQGFGSTVQTTRFMEYGKVTARLKTGSSAPGIVSSLITKSPEGDEIDFEWVGKAPKETQTNYYFNNNIDYTKMVKTVHPFDTFNEFHDYSLDWTPDYIKWYIDGKVVREIYKKDTFDPIQNSYTFPDKPSQVGIGIWDGGRDKKGTLEWAGSTDWSDTSKTFSVYVESLKVECYYKGNETVKFDNHKVIKNSNGVSVLVSNALNKSSAIKSINEYNKLIFLCLVLINLLF